MTMSGSSRGGEEEVAAFESTFMMLSHLLGGFVVALKRKNEQES
jgi:hypothetical protein